MALSVATWIAIIGSVSLLWLPSLWAISRTLNDESEKIELLDRQGEIDTYSPQALRELHDWIQSHPDDEYVNEARNRYNECVEALQEIDESFYTWSDEEIEDLQTISE